jgi:translocation and assembly module TamB
LQFTAVPSEFSISSLEMSVGSSRLSLQGKLADYNNPRVDARYDVLIHTQDFNGMLKPTNSAGDVALRGAVQYQNRAGQPVLRNVVIDGQMSGGELNLTSPDGKIALRSIRGRYRLANGNFNADSISVNLLNGELKATLSMLNVDKNPSSKLQVTLQGISIDAAKNASRAPSLRNLPVSGTVSGGTEATWAGSMQRLLAKSDVVIDGAIQNGSSHAKPVPLNGAVHLDYDGAKKIITFHDSTLHTPASAVVLVGTLGEHSSLTIQARTGDLREISSLASALQSPPANVSGKPSFAIGGSATANATVTGSMNQPHIMAQLAAQNLEVEGTQWKSLRLDAEATPSQVTIRDGSLIAAEQGQVTFSGSSALNDWSYASGNQIALKLAVRQMPVSELQHVARVNYPMSGILSADATLSGTQMDPIGHGSAEITRAKAYDQPIQVLSAHFQAENGAVTSTLEAKLDAGAASAKVVYHPRTTAYELQFDAPKVVLADLQAVRAKNLDVQGTVSAHASGRGTTSDPQLTASLQIPELRWQQTTANDVSLQANVANHRADLALNSGVSQAKITGKATVELSGDYNTVASLDTTSIPVTPLLAAYTTGIPSDLDSHVEVHASLNGPLKNKSRFEAHIEIPTIGAAYQQLQIANSGPIRLDYANSVLTIQPSQLQGTNTSLRFQGNVRMQDNPGIDVTAQGSVNMRLLRMLNSDLQSSGTVDLDVRGSGTPRNPDVAGEIKVQKVSLVPADSPIGLENMNGVLTLSHGRILISELKGQAGGGDISVGGSIAYQPQPQFDLTVNAKSVRILYPDGIRSLLDGDVTVTGTSRASAVDGRVLIESVSFTPEFDLAKFIAAPASPVSPTTNSFADNMKLNIAVQSTENLEAVSSEVSVEGSANLRIVGTAAQPVVVGRADLNSGDIFFMKNRYQLERGIINFVNPNRTEPSVNILITTVIKQYNLNIALVGPVDKLRTTYTSDPPLPPVDIINLVARGQTTEEATPGNFDANQVLAGGLASQVSSQIGKFAGISSLTIDPLIQGANGDPSARLAVQQRITKNFIFTFSTDVTQPEAQIIQGEYQINKRWSVSATRDQYGGYGVDGRYHTTF